jgi:hypothetical protein
MQKIKEKLHIGRNKHHEGEYAEGVDNTYNTGGVAGTGVAGTGATGLAANSMNTSLSGSSGYQEGVVERPVGVGVAEVPVVVTEQERLGMGGGVGGGMGEEVCGTKTFTERVVVVIPSEICTNTIQPVMHRKLRIAPLSRSGWSVCWSTAL